MDGPKKLERETRFELATLSLATRCSTTELFPQGRSLYPIRKGCASPAPTNQVNGTMSVPMPLAEKDFQRLCEIAEEAGDKALEQQTQGVFEVKPDGSIVTPADKNIEVYLRGELTRLVPGSTVWGEELGFDKDNGHGVWLIDPIDGTSNFAFGSPMWGISIAFVKAGKIESGVIPLPGIFETYACNRQFGATCNGELLPSIPEGPIQPVHLISAGESTVRHLGLDALPGKHRSTGAFVIDGCFVAAQRLRGLVGLNERLYDVAASILICEELGAEVRYWDGKAFDVAELLDGQNISRPWVIFPHRAVSFR